jgi:hypothetical protein
VTAQVQRKKSKGTRQIGVELASPGKCALREAMEEKDWLPAWITRLHDVESNASPARNHVTLHRFAPFLTPLSNA